MLPSAARLTSGESFRRALRAGRKSASRTLVLHLAGADADRPVDVSGDVSGDVAARVGFVVSRAVGGAVGRNRVRRRLRHLVRERLAALPAGSVLVIRANPAAANASYDELRHDLDRCLERVLPPSTVSAAAAVEQP